MCLCAMMSLHLAKNISCHYGMRRYLFCVDVLSSFVHLVFIRLRGGDDARSTALSLVLYDSIFKHQCKSTHHQQTTTKTCRYYEPLDESQSSSAADDDGAPQPLGSLAYRLQHVEAQIQRLPSLALVCINSVLLLFFVSSYIDILCLFL
jgi:hypothetical protein